MKSAAQRITSGYNVCAHAICHASEFVPVDGNVRDRATELQELLGIKSYDALHISCAEEAGVDVFLSTDDKLVRAAKRQQKGTKVEIENPLTWLQSVLQ